MYIVKVFYNCTFCSQNIHYKFQALFILYFGEIVYNFNIFCLYVAIQHTFLVHSLSYKILICTSLYTKYVQI